jgi:hypothetical protein
VALSERPREQVKHVGSVTPTIRGPGNRIRLLRQIKGCIHTSGDNLTTVGRSGEGVLGLSLMNCLTNILCLGGNISCLGNN